MNFSYCIFHRSIDSFLGELVFGGVVDPHKGDTWKSIPTRVQVNAPAASPKLVLHRELLQDNIVNQAHPTQFARQ